MVWSRAATCPTSRRRGDPDTGRSRAMETTRLVIEIEQGSEPPAGRIQRAGAERERFAGYLELITALEAVRREPRREIERVDEKGDDAR